MNHLTVNFTIIGPDDVVVTINDGGMEVSFRVDTKTLHELGENCLYSAHRLISENN